MNEIVIIGTGGMAKEIYGLLRDMKQDVLGFVAKDVSQGEFMGLPILGDDEWLTRQRNLWITVAIGQPKLRRAIFERFRDCPLYWPTIIHPDAKIYESAIIGHGCVVQPGGVIQPDTCFGFGTYINMGVTVGHDTSVGDFCVINHNAGISGNVTIGDEVLIGAGATVIENHAIGDRATIGAGAVVTKDVPADETWVGVPAKLLHKPVQMTYAEIYNGH